MRWIALLFLIACSSPKTQKVFNSELVISEHHADKNTALVKQNLIHLTQVYDLEPYMYSRRIDIDPKGSDHPFPTLTLSTKFADRPELILSRFLHEQFLWWLTPQTEAVKKISLALKKEYPHLGKSNYIKLKSSFLESRALKRTIGASAAKKTLAQLSRQYKITPKIYRIVQADAEKLDVHLRKFKLIPPSLE